MFDLFRLNVKFDSNACLYRTNIQAFKRQIQIVKPFISTESLFTYEKVSELDVVTLLQVKRFNYYVKRQSEIQGGHKVLMKLSNWKV